MANTIYVLGARCPTFFPKMKYRSVASVAVAIFVALPSAVLIPTDGWAQIEEIVVTTRRREIRSWFSATLENDLTISSKGSA
jgi:hypothetical protein